jgi:histidine triad (HIT) family protein
MTTPMKERAVAEKTIFQKILDHEIPAKLVHEDDLCGAFLDVSPQAPVHILVVPRKPLRGLSAASDGDSALLGHLVSVARRIAAKEGLGGGFRIVINDGDDGGQSVPHLHVHLLGGRKLSWPPG